ncbi:hypothetical protein QAD02_005215 [Eretmocerus hayati]|uniref:Uncharacterized protein n=1 Tax=Eretmocerus hayati TaxID=131215 RepID=A0ACC2NSY0_9HYME|nr:hypothetical protein QAD02_005215 [Eretmocerus hayati]
MRCIFLSLVVFLRIGNLRTETVEATNENDGKDLINPLNLARLRNLASRPNNNFGGNNEENVWSPDRRSDLPPIYSAFLEKMDFRNNADGIGDTIENIGAQFKSIDQLNDFEMVRLSSYLLKLLQQPEVSEFPPILVKESKIIPENQLIPAELGISRRISKRTRYYREYPWKRPTSRSSSPDYEPYNPCNPSRNDIYELLRALHDARQGNRDRTLNFCNRQRPASAVYTNIRFLG